MKIFNKKLLMTLSMLALTLLVKADIPDWSVSTGNYQYTMTMTVAAKIDNVDIASTDAKIGAFVGDECRGVTSFEYHKEYDKYIGFVTVYADEVLEEITFKIYNNVDDKIYQALQTEEFLVNADIGGVLNPFVISNLELNSESAFESFGFDNVETVTENIQDDVVKLELPVGTDISSLVPVFTTSRNANVYLDKKRFESNTDVLDFSEPVKFKVVSEDGRSVTEYSIDIKVLEDLVVTIDLINRYSQNTLVFDNSSKEYNAWQWYKDGEAVSGATKQYFTDAPLAGTYWVIATNADGVMEKSKPVYIDGSTYSNNLVEVYPNPAIANENIKVVVNHENLDNARIQILDIYGNVESELLNVNTENYVVAPSKSGLYIVMIFTDAKVYSSNIYVK